MSTKSKVINLRAPLKKNININSVFIILFVGIIAFYWLSAPTMKLIDERNQNQMLQKSLKQKLASNSTLREDIGKLKKDSYIELRARKDLGLIKANEIQYYVLTKKQKMKKAMKKVEKPWYTKTLNFFEQTFVR